MPALEAGQLFDRYRVVRLLGSSISGESYEAEDIMLLRKVTLKLIQPGIMLPVSARRQFFREMQGISALKTTYLATTLDYGEMNGILYIARRYVTSGSLLSYDGRTWFRPPFDISDAIRYCQQLAQALEYIHDRGYLHGGLTFSNILVLRGPNFKNETDNAPFLLADVGVANYVRRFGQVQTPLLPITAAPEQLGKRVTPASDQFALAVLLYYWLTGRPPFTGTPDEIEQLKLTETIPSLRSLNPMATEKIEGVILRALSVYPEERFSSVLAFADALKDINASQAEPAILNTVPKHSAFYAPAEPEIDLETFVTTEPEFHLQNSAAPTYHSETTIDEPGIVTGSLVYPDTILFTESIPNTDPELFQDLEQDEYTGDELEFEPVMESQQVPQPEPDIPQPGSEPATIPEPTPDTPQLPPDPTHIPEPEPKVPQPPTIPDPLPQTVPDVPQPLPEPEIPEPLPDPVPRPERGPDIPQPLRDPIPQPVPDVPQPLPQPELPQIGPETIPHTEPFAEETVPINEATIGSNNLPSSLSTNEARMSAISQLSGSQGDVPQLAPGTVVPREAQLAIPAHFIITSPYTEEPYAVLLEKEEATLGRAGSSDILLDKDTLTSRHHALLKHENGHYLIYDQRSANGVFVNGQRIAGSTGYVLVDGDHVSIGNYELIFRFRNVLVMPEEETSDSQADPLRASA